MKTNPGFGWKAMSRQGLNKGKFQNCVGLWYRVDSERPGAPISQRQNILQPTTAKRLCHARRNIAPNPLNRTDNSQELEMFLWWALSFTRGYSSQEPFPSSGPKLCSASIKMFPQNSAPITVYYHTYYYAEVQWLFTLYKYNMIFLALFASSHQPSSMTPTTAAEFQ